MTVYLVISAMEGDYYDEDCVSIEKGFLHEKDAEDYLKYCKEHEEELHRSIFRIEPVECI